MLKQPTQVRALVLSDVDKMSRHLHALFSLLKTTEHDAMLCLEGPQRMSFVVAVTEHVLERFGQKPSVAEPRFNKTHRMANRQIAKPLRGVPRKLADADTAFLEDPQ